MRSFRDFLRHHFPDDYDEDYVKSDAWYVHHGHSGTHYTPFAKTKLKAVPVGPGDRKPTPEEIAKAYNEHYSMNLECEGQLLVEYEYKEARDPGIDLPNGVYSYRPSAPGELPERLIPITLREDTYLKIASIYDPIKVELDAFMNNEKVYRDIGIIYKRAVLLYGPPGTGKTSFIRNLIINEAPKDTVVIFFESMPSNEFIMALKDTLSNKLKLIVFEELANLVIHASLDRVLDFLDGEKSLDRCFMFGTTNYPERLPGNIVDRPSRWDRVMKIGNPAPGEQKIFLEHYLKREPTEDEINLTREFSAAAIKEICILTHLHGLSISDACQRLKKYSELVKNDFAEKRKLGIRGSMYDED